MKYADGPSTEVSVHIDAPPDRVWPVVADVTTPARFSGELQEVERIDETHFRGRNRHPAIGEWETTCTIVASEPGRLFAWVVGDAEHPSAQWRFSLEATGGGTTLRQWMRIGPAPSGLSPAIAAMPDKEERIIARRLEEHRANMQATVEGIKQLVESP